MAFEKSKAQIELAYYWYLWEYYYKLIIQFEFNVALCLYVRNQCKNAEFLSALFFYYVRALPPNPILHQD